VRNLIKLFCIGQDNKTGDFMKRTVFLALALFALMAVGLYAQTEADFGVSKSADGKSITIDEYKGKATAVTIPARIQNLPVTKIEDRVFSSNSSITSVTIPNTVTSIGSSAFAACAYLISVTFQGTIPASGFAANAFGSGMSSIGDIRDKYLAAGGGAGTYTRPDDNSKTWTKQAASTAAAPATDGKFTFTAINSNKEYSVSRGGLITGTAAIPASYNNLPVTAIADAAFIGINFTAVTIPDSVKTIGNNAFVDCKLITNITIPSSVTRIGNNAFLNCEGLTSVTIQGTIPANNFFGFDGDLKTKYLAGGAGTYTRPAKGVTWTKK
jgi:hypothetical protein